MFWAVAMHNDAKAIEALRILSEMGFPTRTIRIGESAEPGEVAIFSLNGEAKDIHFPGKYASLAAHRFDGKVVPDWASATPYQVALRRNAGGRKNFQAGFLEAVKWIGKRYGDYFSGRKVDCPWGSPPTDPEMLAKYDKWRNRAEKAPIRTEKNIGIALISMAVPLGDDCQSEAAKRCLEKPLPEAVSALCFHANEARTAIVSGFHPKAVEGVVSYIRQLPVSLLDIYTFHPEDIPLIRDHGLDGIILGAIRNDEVQFAKQWLLSSEICDRTDGKARLKRIGEFLADSALVKSAWEEARNRAERMHERIMHCPPPIFRNLTGDEQRERLASEAVLYLLMTRACADKIYVGFEVHAEYWKSGELFRWDESFLPVLFAPACLRQHWASWSVDDKRLEQIASLGF